MTECAISSTLGKRQQRCRGFGQHTQRHYRRALASGVRDVKRSTPLESELIGAVPIIKPHSSSVKKKKVKIIWFMIDIIKISQIANKNSLKLRDIPSAAAASPTEFLQHPSLVNQAGECRRSDRLRLGQVVSVPSDFEEISEGAEDNSLIITPCRSPIVRTIVS